MSTHSSTSSPSLPNQCIDDLTDLEADVSPYIEVISPSPPSALESLDDEETPYIEDNDFLIYIPPVVQYTPDSTPDLSIGTSQSPNSPSAGSASSGPYYSAKSHLSELSSSDYDQDMVDVSNNDDKDDSESRTLAGHGVQALRFNSTSTLSLLSNHVARPYSVLFRRDPQPPQLPLEPLSPLFNDNQLQVPRGITQHASTSESVPSSDGGMVGHLPNLSVSPPSVLGKLLSTNPGPYLPKREQTRPKGSILSQQLQQYQGAGGSSNLVQKMKSINNISQDRQAHIVNPGSSNTLSSPPPMGQVVEAHNFLSIPHRVESSSNPRAKYLTQRDEPPGFESCLGDIDSGLIGQTTVSGSAQLEPTADLIPQSRPIPVLSSTSLLSGVNPGHTHPPSLAARSERGFSRSPHQSTAQRRVRVKPYPLEARLSHKRPRPNALTPNPPLPIQAHTQRQWLSERSTEIGDLVLREENDMEINSPERLRFLASQIARNKELRNALRQNLSGNQEAAQVILDYLNVILHEGDILQSDGGSKLLRLLYKLAEGAQIYPKRLLLKGVEMASQPFEGGGFADVYKGKHGVDEVCIKVIRIFDSRGQSQLLSAYVREIILWSHMSHENILPFYGLYALEESARRICLVSPLMNNGNMRVYLHNNPTVRRLPLVLDIIDGLLYLHKSKIVHGDLKAQNILISDDGRALITDFGLSYIAMTTATRGSTELMSAGTINWMAPELLTTTEPAKPTKESDVWSFGCLCYEVFTGNYPFHNFQHSAQVIVALLKGDLPARPSVQHQIYDQLDGWIWDLMTLGCWQRDPSARYTCEEIRDILMGHVMQDDRPRTYNWNEKKSAFWQTMQDRSENHVDYENVEYILVQLLESHDNNMMN